MSYEAAIGSITPEIYQRLHTALELGHWPDGRQMSEQQRRDSMQAVIAYDQLNLSEHERTGYIDRGKKAGEVCDDEATPLSWKASL